MLITKQYYNIFFVKVILYFSISLFNFTKTYEQTVEEAKLLLISPVCATHVNNNSGSFFLFFLVYLFIIFDIYLHILIF